MFEETWDLRFFQRNLKQTADFHGKPTFEAFGFYQRKTTCCWSQPAVPPCCAVPTVEEAITARQNAIDFAPTGPPLLMTFWFSIFVWFSDKRWVFPIWKLNVQTGKSRMFFKDPFPRKKTQSMANLDDFELLLAGKNGPPPSAQELRKNKNRWNQERRRKAPALVEQWSANIQCL